MNLEPLLLSFQVALTASLIATVVGVLVAGVLATVKFPGRNVIDALITAPMVLPPTVLGYYLLVSIGRTSTIGRVFEELTGSSLVFTKTAVVLAATVAALPLIVKSARAAIEDVDPRLAAVAATLGASPVRVFFTVLVPLAANGILAGVTLGFARALGDFGVTLMVAGNIPGLTQTGALAIYDAVQASQEARAAGMVAVMTGIAVAALYFGNRLTRGRPHAF